MGENPPVARLCVLEKKAIGDEFGFNLVGKNESSEGRWIGQVDPGSIAESAGLRDGDKLIMVNSKLISGWTHSQVVKEIKSNPLATRLTVIDPRGFQLPTDSQVAIHLLQPNDSGLSDMNESNGDDIKVESVVEEKPTEVEPVQVHTVESDSVENVSVPIGDMSDIEVITDIHTLSLDEGLPLDTSDFTDASLTLNLSAQEEEKSTAVEEPIESKVDQMEPKTEPNSTSDLDFFHLSAAEVKAKLMANRRVDSRKFQQIPIKEKMEILKTL